MRQAKSRWRTKLASWGWNVSSSMTGGLDSETAIEPDLEIGNTDALDRLALQDGFTHADTPETMAAWVTDVPNFLDKRAIPLQFRFVSAMQGALGIGET
ncbi:alpha-galactosidase [Edaphobacter lichenicola]|uniref:Alpha-galactosidase n=1 Tax=Tunturiibacter lichenicola TaxID=2051959 RepID=A0A7Y9NP45_9BACT|nr:alpha-galactosidase [Edaphobacter lichenicola]